jgi:hypothetical protein
LLSAAIFLLATATCAAPAPVPSGTFGVSDIDLTPCFPNSQAVVASRFVPGIEDGFVPQGFAPFRSGYLLSGYFSIKTKGCRFYVLDSDKRITAKVDLQSGCSHAGGVSGTPEGKVMISDTRQLFVFAANEDGKFELETAVALSSNLRGTFIKCVEDGFYIGSYLPGDMFTNVYFFSYKALDYSSLTPIDGELHYQLPASSQGFDILYGYGIVSTSQGNPNKISFSDSSGNLLAQYDFITGSQSIFMNDDGLLETLSESGVEKYKHWKYRYPAMITIDPNRLY